MTVKMTMEEYKELEKKAAFAEAVVERAKKCYRKDAEGRERVDRYMAADLIYDITR